MKELIVKRVWALLLVIAMMLAIGAQPVMAAENHSVTPANYKSVAAKIAAAQEETVISQPDGDIHYYWGEDFFVVHDNSGYYLVEINEDFTHFYVNGKRYDISTNEAAVDIASVTFPTAWITIADTNNSFDVGGLPCSVVGGLVGGVVGGAVGSAVAGAVAGMFLGGIFPIDYKITVLFLKKSRIAEPGVPTIMEYYERVAVYGGPSSNLYQTELYYNTRTYIREQWD